MEHFDGIKGIYNIIFREASFTDKTREKGSTVGICFARKFA